MGSSDVILDARKALKLVNETEDSPKHEGFKLLDTILGCRDKRLAEYGYDKLIMKELIKLTKFEPPCNLRKIRYILFRHYAKDEGYQDEIMEALLYRYGLSTDFDVTRECLEQISVLIDQMNDNVAKHSKQIMQAADMNNFVSLNEVFIVILEKLKTKLPTRKAIS